MKVLLHLQEGDMYKGELSSKITIGTAAIQSRIDDLIDLGLVNETPQTIKPFKKILSLTEKGQKIAKMIQEIDDLLMDKVDE